MRSHRSNLIAIALIGIACAQQIFSRELGTATIRELAVYADAVVVADVLDELDRDGHAVLPEDGKPQRIHFKVRDVLRAATAEPVERTPAGAIKHALPLLEPGALISCDMWEYALAHSEAQAVPRIERCVLFLVKPQNDERYRVCASGVRYKPLSTEQVLLPIQERNPGPWCMHLEENMNWAGLVKLTRSELRLVAELRDVRAEHDLRVRAKGLLAWIEAHRDELAFSRDPRAGLITTKSLWGGVEKELFEEISMSPDPEHAWKALRLWGEWISPACAELPGIGFCAKSKRDHLMQIATDDSLDARSRRLALCQLCGQNTFWCTWDGAESISSKDRLRYLESLKASRDQLKVPAKEGEELREALDRTIKSLDRLPSSVKE